MTTTTPSQLSALSRLFSATVFREMARTGKSRLFRDLLSQTGLQDTANVTDSVGDIFDYALDILKAEGNRDEYVYRAALSKELFIDKHHPQSTAILSEFRISNSKADLVVLNGTATVYEIKSDRDSLARLLSQVENYKRVFPDVNVVSSHYRISSLLKILPLDVGVMSLDGRNRLVIERESRPQPETLSPIVIFESLRTSECAAILAALGKSVPHLPNTQMRASMLKLFAQLDPIQLHSQLVTTLKRTRARGRTTEILGELPESLKAAVFSFHLRGPEHAKFLNAIKTPLHLLTTWS